MTINNFITIIDKDKENLKNMFNHAYKLLMFYLIILINDYDEDATECNILNLLVIVNDIIYNYIVFEDYKLCFQIFE